MISSHILVTRGGVLFESYLEGLSSYSSNKQWLEIKAAIERDEEYTVDEHLEEEIVCRERGGFHGFVIKSMADIRNKGKKQLFFSTFVARYHGLSRMGTKLLSFFGFTTSMSNYDNIKRDTIELAHETTRSKNIL